MNGVAIKLFMTSKIEFTIIFYYNDVLLTSFNNRVIITRTFKNRFQHVYTSNNKLNINGVSRRRWLTKI